ncbi:MAG: ECF transporter S component [Filifactoraceae bacterium]
MKKTKTNVMVKTAILAVLAYIIMFLEIPLPPFPPFLKLDLSDIPAIIGGFALGPIAGIMIELIKNLLHFVIQTSTAGVGELGNFIVGSSFVVIATSFYKRNHSKKGAVVGCLIATIGMAVVGAVVNRFMLLPFYANIMPIESIIAMGSQFSSRIKDLTTMSIYLIAPFNLIKGCVISLVTILIYKKVSPLIKN